MSLALSSYRNNFDICTIYSIRCTLVICLQAQEETVNLALEQEAKWGLAADYVSDIILGLVMEQM